MSRPSPNRIAAHPIGAGNGDGATRCDRRTGRHARRSRGGWTREPATPHARPDRRRRRHSHPVTRGDIEIPFFAWFFRPFPDPCRERQPRTGRGPAPRGRGGPSRPPRTMVGLPPVAFGRSRASCWRPRRPRSQSCRSRRRCSASSALDPDTFGTSDADMGLAFALTRVGALFALVRDPLADRRGRRGPSSSG